MGSLIFTLYIKSQIIRMVFKKTCLEVIAKKVTEEGKKLGLCD